MSRIKISVTQEDIDCGKRNQPEACPIALAIFRVTGKRWSIDGTVANGVLGRDRLGPALKMPARATTFIIAFDSRGPGAVRPFSFKLEIPSDSD